MSLSQSEIYTLAKKAGLSSERARVASAIAMAESSGDPNQHNAVPPDDSWGLWQINMTNAAGGPARRIEFGLKHDSDLTNPVVNARAMSSISRQGQTFTPWSTYKDGKYKKYMNNTVGDSNDPGFLDSINQWTKNLLGQGKDAAADLPGVSQAEAVASSVSQVSQVVTKTAVWVSNPQNWIRIAYVVGGGAVIIGGIVMIVQSSSAGRAATKAAGKALPL